MTYKEVKEAYQTIIDKETLKQSAVSKKIFEVGTLRLIVVIACIIISYFFWDETSVVVATLLGSCILFFILMTFHNKLFNRRLYSEIQVRNAQNELKALNYDFSPFEAGEEYLNAEHNFSLDLDLFGKQSFFQSINRTVTSFGKDFLSESMLQPLTNKEHIYQRQEAIGELAANHKLLMHFRTIGQMSGVDNLNLKDFAEIFARKPVYFRNLLWKSLTYIVPLLYVIWFILWLSDVIIGDTFMYLWALMVALSAIPSKKVLKIYSIFDKKTETLDTYSRLFKILEEEKFSSPLLKSIQAELKASNEKTSQAISRLKSYHNNLGLAFTFPTLLILNPLFLWNVVYSSKVEKWIDRYSSHIAGWFNTVAQFDTLISMSLFAYNHPDYTYPEVTESFTFEGQALGHPLINRDVCVRNDLKISKKPYFLVITGANMAGKSTYLRTVGINHMLACTGMPVCAHNLKFYPSKLVTNLRTSDSLADNESYFFAELKRLKMIIDRLQAGEELFIILDEILKGTNSEDKQKGSLALMRQLISLDGNGIIATHDLVLGNLEKEYPDNVKAYCFEAEIKDDKLTFSYKIYEGIAQNMNACFLMKRMGITGL